MYLRTGFLITGYAILFITRFITEIEVPFEVYNDSDLFFKIAESVSIVAMICLWIALYFFIFQIEKIKLTLEATNLVHLQRSLKRKQLVNMVVLAVYIVADVIYILIKLYKIFTDTQLTRDLWHEISFGVQVVLRLSDLYLSLVFIFIVRYYYSNAKKNFRAS